MATNQMEADPIVVAPLCELAPVTTADIAGDFYNQRSLIGHAIHNSSHDNAAATIIDHYVDSRSPEQEASHPKRCRSWLSGMERAR